MKKNNKNNPATNGINGKSRNNFAILSVTRESLSDEQRKALNIMFKEQNAFMDYMFFQG